MASMSASTDERLLNSPLNILHCSSTWLKWYINQIIWLLHWVIPAQFTRWCGCQLSRVSFELAHRFIFECNWCVLREKDQIPICCDFMAIQNLQFLKGILVLMLHSTNCLLLEEDCRATKLIQTFTLLCSYLYTKQLIVTVEKQTWIWGLIFVSQSLPCFCFLFLFLFLFFYFCSPTHSQERASTVIFSPRCDI